MGKQGHYTECAAVIFSSELIDFVVIVVTKGWYAEGAAHLSRLAARSSQWPCNRRRSLRSTSEVPFKDVLFLALQLAAHELRFFSEFVHAPHLEQVWARCAGSRLALVSLPIFDDGQGAWVFSSTWRTIGYLLRKHHVDAVSLFGAIIQCVAADSQICVHNRHLDYVNILGARCRRGMVSSDTRRLSTTSREGEQHDAALSKGRLSPRGTRFWVLCLRGTLGFLFFVAPLGARGAILRAGREALSPGALTAAPFSSVGRRSRSRVSYASLPYHGSSVSLRVGDGMTAHIGGPLFLAMSVCRFWHALYPKKEVL